MSFHTSRYFFNYLRLIHCNVIRRHNVHFSAKNTTISAARQLSLGCRFTNKLNLNDNLNINRLRQVSHANSTIGLTQIEVTLKQTPIGSLSQKNRILLVRGCGKALSNKPLDFRKSLSDKVWKKLTAEKNLSLEDYDAYVQTCTENEVEICHKTFIASLPGEPTRKNLQLLLRNACEMGNVADAIEILDKMKNRCMSIDESVFNLLVLGYAINSGLKGVRSILDMMRAAQVPETSDTYWCLLKGLARRVNMNEFLKTVENSTLQMNDEYFFDVLLALGINENDEWLPKLMKKLEMESLPSRLHQMLRDLCVNLVHRGKPVSAVKLYISLIKATPDGGYAKFLLEEMLAIPTDIDSILNVTEQLKKSARNPFALEDITDLALRKGEMETASVLLDSFEVLRPHYFWPLIVDAGKRGGEVGVINILGKMLSKKVEVNTETMTTYFNRYWDFSNPKALVTRLKAHNLSVRQLLTPILSTVLKSGDISLARKLCDEYNVVVQSRVLIRPLAIAWIQTKDAESALVLLKRICESNDPPSMDYTGLLLKRMITICKNKQDYDEFLKFIKVVNQQKLRITTEMGDLLHQMLQIRQKCAVSSEMEEVIDELCDASIKQTGGKFKHPKNMDVNEMECHLTELRSKNMEVRGILRRLIQAHSQLGNEQRVEELRQQFNDMGYSETPGLKATLLVSYLKGGNLSPAMQVYKEIRKQSPDFKLDDHKIVDMATLMVSTNQVDRAIKLLEDHVKNRSRVTDNYADRNCVNLLSAAKNSKDARRMLIVLTSNGYCSPKNILLGPVVRSYLKCNDLDGAVNFFIECTEKYSCTPLQMELLCAAVESQNESTLQTILTAASNVHGRQNTMYTLVAALAEKGMKNALNKLLLEIKHFPTINLRSRLQRWVQEGKLQPMETMASAASRLSGDILNVHEVYLAIIQYYGNNNDCDGVVAFIRSLQEQEVTFTKPLINEVNNLFTRCKYSIPSDLTMQSAPP